MDLANWAVWARMAAVLAAVAFLVWWLRKNMVPLITIGGVRFSRRDLLDLASFRKNVAENGQEPDWFLVANESAILRAIVLLGRCPRLLDELISQITPIRALLDAITEDCKELVEVVVLRREINERHIESALAGRPPGPVREALLQRWEALTGRKWKNGPDWPPSRHQEYGPSGPTLGRGGPPEPAR